MPRWLIVLLFWTWWSFGPRATLWEKVYHVFNLFEGSVWVLLAVLVLRRAARSGRRSALEGWYALAFFTFGLTDFREAYVLNTWLIGVKLVNLVILFRLRATVIRRYYPESKLY